MPNREEWLTSAAGSLKEYHSSLKDVDARYSVGFPRGKGRRKIGQCWGKSSATDGKCQIFICPTLESPEDVLTTLLHELIHAALPEKTGHRGEFISVAKELGFTKPWTSTPPNEELKSKLIMLAGQLGPFPHSAINLTSRKGPGSNLRLWECACEPKPIKLRVARDELNVFCGDCGEVFVKRS